MPTSHFSEPERQFYSALFDKSQCVFEGFIRSGTASRSWLAIFSLLHRLRQACDHVALTVKSRFDVGESSSFRNREDGDSERKDATGSNVPSETDGGLLNEAVVNEKVSVSLFSLVAYLFCRVMQSAFPPLISTLVIRCGNSITTVPPGFIEQVQ